MVLLIYVFDTIVIAHYGLLYEILEQGVHLVGLRLQVIVVCGLELQRRDKSLLQLLEVEVVGFCLYFSLTLGLEVGCFSAVAVLNGPSYLRFNITALLVKFCTGLV